MYSKPENVLFRTIDDDTLLLNTVNGHYYSLDGIGGRIWALMLEGHDGEAIASLLEQEHEGESTEILTGVQDLIADLLQEGLIKLEPQLQPV